MEEVKRERGQSDEQRTPNLLPVQTLSPHPTSIKILKTKNQHGNSKELENS